jgi:hypothetical protein
MKKDRKNYLKKEENPIKTENHTQVECRENEKKRTEEKRREEKRTEEKRQKKSNGNKSF